MAGSMLPQVVKLHRILLSLNPVSNGQFLTLQEGVKKLYNSECEVPNATIIDCDYLSRDIEHRAM